MIDYANNRRQHEAQCPRHLASIVSSREDSTPTFYGVTQLNLSINEVNQDGPSWQPSDVPREAIEALEGTSSRMELSAAYADPAHPLTLLGHLDEAQAASSKAAELDELEPNLR